VSAEGFWKWELERRLAVARWEREDAEFADEDQRIQAARGPILARRQQQLGIREHEESMMQFGGLRLDQAEARVRRIVVEDTEWLAATGAWEAEDKKRLLTREGREARRCAEIERWLDENAWELVNLDVAIPASRRLMQ
jgi:hypothetical protein